MDDTIFFKRLSLLCKGHKTTISKFVKENLGLSPAAATQWKNGAYPSASIVVRVARYFDVSSDYILGLTDDPRGSYYISTDNLRYLQNYLVHEIKAHNLKAELLVSSMFKLILDSKLNDSDNFSIDPTFEYSKSMEESEKRFHEQLEKRGRELLEQTKNEKK